MATWKKVIVSGSSAELNNLVVDNHVSASLFSGSFYGDGSGLTNIVAAGTISASAQVDHDQTLNFVANEHINHTSVSITAGVGLTGGGDISSTRTINIGIGAGISGSTTDISVDSGSLAAYYSSSAFSVVSGDLTITAGGTAAIANNVVDENNLTTSVAGTGLSGGNGSALSVDYGSSAGTAAQGNTGVTFSGTTNEIELSTNTFTTVGGGGSVTIGLPDSVSITSNLTVGGDLTVSGDLTYLNTANLLVEDPYILLRSGSAAVGDSGIIFGGSEGSLNAGNLFFWDADYNTNDGRLAIASNVAQNATGDQTPSYHIAGVFEGTEGDAATAQADHVGNIRVESGEIYIYV